MSAPKKRPPPVQANRGRELTNAERRKAFFREVFPKPSRFEKHFPHQMEKERNAGDMLRSSEVALTVHFSFKDGNGQIHINKVKS